MKLSITILVVCLVSMIICGICGCYTDADAMETPTQTSTEASTEAPTEPERVPVDFSKLNFFEIVETKKYSIEVVENRSNGTYYKVFNNSGEKCGSLLHLKSAADAEAYFNLLLATELSAINTTASTISADGVEIQIHSINGQDLVIALFGDAIFFGDRETINSALKENISAGHFYK